VQTTGHPTERSFGLSIGGVCLALAALAWWRSRPLMSLLLLFTGILLVSLGAVAPSVLRLPNRVWWLFAQRLGWVNARILLSVFFALVFTPVGVVMRLFGRNALSGHRPDTNWRPYPSRRADPRHYEHLF
jgi:hypothetical protein